MQTFEFDFMDIDKLCVITPFFVEDERGHLLKNYEKNVFEQNGLPTTLSETFESYSKKGVLRGMHFQVEKPQAKLVRCTQGEIFDVAVDLRKNSNTFGQWRFVTLSGENNKTFYIPAGFAHGFLTLSENALVTYMCAGDYMKESDTGICWNDSDININWPLEQLLNSEVIVSERDQNLLSLKQFVKEFEGLKC